MSKTIGVLGCGWLGRPLAKSFVEDGYRVRGTTTSEEKCILLQKEAIRPYLITLHEDRITGDVLDFFLGLEVLVINIPPRLRNGKNENYVKKMQLLYNTIKTSKTKKIVLVSSTSVYGDVDGEVTEKTIPKPHTESGKQLLASEAIFRNNPDRDTTIVRFGGLIGPNRHPITTLSGKEGLPNGQAAVNLIHLDDCIDIIRSIVQNGWWNETFNAVYPHHPNKQDYYTSEAKKRGLIAPLYQGNRRGNSKKIDSCSLTPVKKYRFKTSILS